MSEFRKRKWSDQSRGPSAIDAPSHNGFGLYSHFQAEYSMVITIRKHNHMLQSSSPCEGTHRPGCDTRPLNSVDPLRLFERADVLDDRIAPAIDIHPLAIANSVLVAGHIDYVRLLRERCRC